STIRDAAGNNATLTLSGHVPATTGILVDTIAPTVAGNVSVPANGTYVAGQNLDFTVTFDENVVVAGSDSTLGLTIGATAHNAGFLSSSGNTITYRYTVQAGDTDADGITVGTITAGTSTIRDAAGNDASLALSGHVPATTGVLVDATVPSIAGNIAVPANATYVAGQTLNFTVTFDENVTVTGSDSTLGLTIGGTTRSAAFASSAGNTVTYTYTVQAGDTDTDGIAVGAI
ncbi:Ig-like domain-containing protein, partial [Massilia sp. Root335]|uniref:Ig-like domain-containing protein n=1 Tax=Massilia sp. Root335 TaxID=1736517 RepID=UPI00138EFDDA